MDEDKMDDILKNIDAPEPSKTSQKQAVNAAMTAFDEKNAKKAQGSATPHRLTDMNPLNHVRRYLMKKKYVLSGLGGAVALTALVAVLGTPFYQERVSQLSGAYVQNESDLVDLASNISAGNEPNLKQDGQKEVSEAYVQAIEEGNIRSAKQAAKQGASAIPRSVDLADKNQGVKVPNTKSSLDKDPLTAWKSTTDSSRQSASKDEAKRSRKMKPQVAEEMARVPAAMTGSSVVPQSVSPGKASNFQAFRAPAPGVPHDMPTYQYQDEGRDKFDSVKENNVKQVKAEPVSTFSIDVDTASYAFMRRQINQGRMPAKNSIRIEELVNYFPYNYPLAETREEPFKPTVAVYDTPWKEGSKMIHIGIKGYDIDHDEKPKSNLVFLIDVSGSMRAQDKLPLLKNSMKMVLDTLNPDDTIGIVTYAGRAGTALEPTPVSEKHKILSVLENLQSGGSTAGAAGLKGAYALAEQAKIEDGVNRVILATDGDFNVGMSNHEELKTYIEKKRDTGIFLSVLGFGQGNYNDQLMQALAQNGNGNAAYIDSLNEARKVLVEEASSTLFPIAKDVKIQVEFNPAMVKEYRLVGYETRHLNREDFNNDKIDAGEIGAGHTVTAIYEIVPVHGGKPLVDDLRYQSSGVVAPPVKEMDVESGHDGEYAFLKIRYKQPDAKTSQLMTRPITAADHVSFDAASNDIRFAAAVAGFGQLLKGGTYTGSLTYDQILNIATAARGSDEFGYRTEFANLVRLAKTQNR